MYKKIIIASGPVIVKDNKVLLDISGEDNFWKFCGGKVEENETLQETAMRRTEEELGIQINLQDESPFLMYIAKEKDRIKNDVILVHWLADFTGEIFPGKDVKKWEWLSLDDLNNYDLAPNIIPTLKHFGFIK